MHIEEWDWYVLVGAVCFMALLVMVFILCLVYLCCWGFRCAKRVLSKAKSDLKNVSKHEKGLAKALKPIEVGEQYWVAQTDYVIYQTGKDGLVEKKLQCRDASFYQSNEREINLKCTPFTVNRIIGENAEFSAAKMKIKLSYRMLNGDSTMGRLTVYLMEINSLPYREYSNSLEPYVVLDVINNKSPIQKNERVVQTVQSRVVRHTFNPKFDQIFLFDVKRSEMKDWCLKFTVFDKNRLTKSTPICERRIFMRDIQNLTSESDILLLAELHEICTNNGQILFGASYLPTAQRLNISIIQASELKFLTVTQTLNEFNPYVRVLMLNGQGKCIKKKKTSVRHSEDNPIFNETLVFDLSVSNLENAIFLLVLCSKNLGKHFNGNGSVEDAGQKPSSKDSKDDVLGAVVVGKNVKSLKARNHWLMVMQNPRKVISVWHQLR